MSTTVIGIDPSLRRTGLARITYADEQLRAWGQPEPVRSVQLAQTVETWVRPSSGRPSDDLDRRARRLFGIAADVLAFALPCELVVIEGPSFGSGVSGSAWDRAGLWWRIVGRLTDAEVAVAVVPPQTRAKWITGRGNADKVQVREAVTRLWHPWWMPRNQRDDNEADALVLASMGAQWLGLPVPAGPKPTGLSGGAWPDRESVPV